MSDVKNWNARVERATRNHVSYFIPPSYHWGVWTDTDVPEDLKDGDTIVVRTNADGDRTLGFTWRGVFYEAVPE